jgi:chaperonin GroEL (HSP60 family)
MEKVMFNENVKEKLINGVNLLADAVKTTYGPNGQNVISNTVEESTLQKTELQ